MNINYTQKTFENKGFVGGQSLINKKGFTLIELLAVIVILAIISLIAVPIILGIISDARETAFKENLNNIFHAFELYEAKNVLNEITDKISVTDESFPLKSNFKTGVVYRNADGEIEVDNVSDGVYCASGTKDKLSIVKGSCDKLDKEKPSNPVLGNLTPVVYDGTNWKVVSSTDTTWYDYSNQKWANAVLLKSGVTKEAGNTVDVSSEVQGMFVWIPRYEYKIEGQYGTHKDGTEATEDLPGEIEVKFIAKSKTTADSGYRIHPAFTFGDKELDGIWVGKFETTGTGDNPTILPSVNSLVEQNVSTQFATARKFNVTSMDSHMAKNSEWGAVAYLSQSIYGKYGNPNYSGAEKEVAINNCSDLITGIGGDAVSASSSSTSCTTNTYETEKGQGASTTGNITGVYDMSGGAAEYVMGVYRGSDASSTWGASSDGTNYAEFTSAPDSKYFDEYTTDDIATTCNSGICYGHALSETIWWYGDYSDFVFSSYPWMTRGGYCYDDAGAGVFASHSGSGDAYSDNSFRVVLAQTTVKNKVN